MKRIIKSIINNMIEFESNINIDVERIKNNLNIATEEATRVSKALYNMTDTYGFKMK